MAGGIATGPTQDLRAVQDDARDGVVDGARDRAIVQQEKVGDSAQAFQGLIVTGTERLVTQIPARCNDGTLESGEQEVV
jgi:hypothetical protein